MRDQPSRFRLRVISRPLGGGTRVLLISVGLAGFTTGSWPAYAQTADLAGFSSCADCEVEARPAVQLGEREAPGIIEADWAHVVYDTVSGRFAVFHRGGSRVVLFDESGAFLRVIGREGRGPGEIGGLSDVQFMGGELLALDAGNRKLLLFTSEGDLSLERRIEVNPGWMEVVGPDHVVVGSMNLTPELVGYPFHLLAVREGGSPFHFGAGSADWSAARPFARDVVVGSSTRAGTVWRGDRVRMRFEEWSIEGILRRVHHGEFDWFPEGGGLGDAPRPIVLDFGVDHLDRLFVLTHVPDPRWRSVPRHGPEGRIERADIGSYRDSRLDVFDLSEERHLGTLLWDEPYAGLVRLGATYGLQRVEYDRDLVPRVVVYRISPGN